MFKKLSFIFTFVLILFFGLARAQSGIIGPNCKAWFDGCNNCSRSSFGAVPLCTKRYCDDGHMKDAYCKAFFHNPDAGESGQTTQAPKSFKEPPVPMDEAGEINPVRFTEKPKSDEAYEIIDDSLSNYSIATSADQNDKDLLPAYDDGGIHLNIKNGDIFKDKIEIHGYIDSAVKTRWTASEATAGLVKLEAVNKSVLMSKPIALKKTWLDDALHKQKLWFDISFDLKHLALESGSYLLEFQNENPSGLSENSASFTVGIKVKQKDKKITFEDRLRKIGKFKNAKILWHDKERHEAELSMSKTGKLLFIIPVSYEIKFLIDDQNLLIKDIKQPWWTWMLF